MPAYLEKLSGRTPLVTACPHPHSRPERLTSSSHAGALSRSPLKNLALSSTGEHMTKQALMHPGPRRPLHSAIEGCYFNVVGLPLAAPAGLTTSAGPKTNSLNL